MQPEKSRPCVCVCRPSSSYFERENGKMHRISFLFFKLPVDLHSISCLCVCVFFLSTEREKLKIKGEREREIKYSTSLKKKKKKTRNDA